MSLRAFEQQGGSCGAQRAVADLGHLEPRRDRQAYPPQQAGGLEPGNEVPQISIFHGILLRSSKVICDSK